MLDHGGGEQPRSGQEEDGPRGAIDPHQVTRFEGAENQSQPEAEREPPQQRAAPHPENQNGSAAERRLLAAEAENREDAEEGEDRDRIGQCQGECRCEVAQGGLGVALRVRFGFGSGEQGGAADIEEVTPAGYSQPLLVADQPIGNEGQAESRNKAEDRVGRGGTKTRDKAGQLALENRPADT